MEYSYRTIEMEPDYEGRVIITILSNKNRVDNHRAILYIHGYIDYFFQDHLAERAVEEGYNFYAIDLRKYGRSYLKGQHFNYCRSLDEYFADITEAINIALGDGCSDITLLGHSTGGLLASLYCARGEKRGYISSLLLNAPFLEFNTAWIKRKLLIPISALIGKVFPYSSKANEINENYNTSIDISKKGEWSYNKELKPQSGVPLYHAWVGAIYGAHREIKHGLNISCRVLVISSSRSTNPRKWCNSATESDIVLNVEHIRKLSTKLGNRVDYTPIEGGIHDLFLSKKSVREHALSHIFDWLGQQQGIA